MPIYAYRCEACGFAKDVLQKVSDAALTECPSCSQAAFKKQVTAAGFQLKGTGWYVTDFRNNGSASATPGGAGAKSGGDSAGQSATSDKSAVAEKSASAGSGADSSGAANKSAANCG